MPALCLIVPCYNEARRLPAEEILGYLAGDPHLHVCLVDDGSRDGTAALLESIGLRRPGQVLVHQLNRNGGKGEAVRQGMLRALATNRFDIVGYWDADLSTPLAEVARLRAVLDADPRCLLAMGSRVKRLGAAIERRVVRHVLGRLFSTSASAVLGLPVYDSQCGAKLFRAELAAVLFREAFSTTWLFDVELLARMRDHLGHDETLIAVSEVPLTAWREVGGSKLGLRHMARVPRELLAIRARYPIRRPADSGLRGETENADPERH